MRWVIKTGSATLSKSNGQLDQKSVDRLATQIALLKKKKQEVVLVSSGAIAAGVGRLKLSQRPTELKMKQSAAAIGQVVLMEAYEKAFSKHKLIPAQILLIRDDLAHAGRCSNFQHTLTTLLSLNVIPIINENDTVSTDEIQFGDNDYLSALVATKIKAQRLVLLSDVRGYYELDKEGRITDRVIPHVRTITPAMKKAASRKQGSKLSVGGIAAKLSAASLATSYGIETWLTSGLDPKSLSRVSNREPNAGTCFAAQKKRSPWK